MLRARRAKESRNTEESSQPATKPLQPALSWSDLFEVGRGGLFGDFGDRGYFRGLGDFRLGYRGLG